jgi:hypothetical protein
MHTLEPEGERRTPTAGGVSTGNPMHVGNLDISPADDGCVIYDPEQDRIHFLNPTAVLILELCNGENSLEQIADLVKQAYGLPEAPAEDVREALKQLKAEGLLLGSGETN